MIYWKKFSGDILYPLNLPALILSRESQEFNRGARCFKTGMNCTGRGRDRKVLYDQRGHSLSAGAGVHRAKGGTTGAKRAPEVPLEEIWRG